MIRNEALAEALGVAPEIVPYLAKLLADIWQLGSWSDAIIEMLRSLELPVRSTEVLELGCGKGAVSLSVAKELGFRVRGVDLFPPFVREAQRRAKTLGVADLCHFEVDDMRVVLEHGKPHDVVIFASVGGILGNFAECVRQLRQVCRSRGYLVIDDGFLAKSTRLERRGYEHYRSHEETLQQLTRHGDSLIAEKIMPVTELEAYNRRNTELFRARANKLAREHPEMAEAFIRYVQWEEAESDILDTQTIPAIWVLQKQ